ncbi:hypothetical protein GCM10027053_46350 [Intrasporangium mesophilum]
MGDDIMETIGRLLRRHDTAAMRDADDHEAEEAAAAAYGRMIGADLTRQERADRARHSMSVSAKSRHCHA